MDWLDLLAVQGTRKSLLQHHSSKASILWCSAFFTVQLSHPYVTTGKTIALTRRTFVGKVMSLLLNMLSRLVITFLPRSKHLLVSWLQSPSADFGAPQNKVWHCFHSFPIYFPMLYWYSFKLVNLICELELCMHAKLLQLYPTLCDLWTVDLQAPLFMGFSRQEYCSGLPCSPSGDLPNLGIKPKSFTSPAVAGGFFTTSATWEVPVKYEGTEKESDQPLCWQ